MYVVLFTNKFHVHLRRLGMPSDIAQALLHESVDANREFRRKW